MHIASCAVASVPARMSGRAASAHNSSKCKRCVVIINPAGANGGAKQLWQKLETNVSTQLNANGFLLEQKFTSGPGSAAQLAAAAVQEGAEVVLAVGGDGTIHEVVSGLVHTQQLQQHRQQQSQTALAVLPLGTGSDYARTYGWRLNDAAAACQRIISGKQQLTDVSVFRHVAKPAGTQPAADPVAANLGAAAPADATEAVAAAGGVAADADTAVTATGAVSAADAATAAAGVDLERSGCRYMVNVASCAAGAVAAARAESLKWLGPLCYKLGGALELLKWKGCTIQVCMDDSHEWQTLDHLTTLVLGQGRFWGGGLQILPDADPTDGLLDVVALQGLGMWDFISKGHLLRTGQHLNVKGVNVLGKCRRLQVKAAEPGAALAWECDGEPQGHFETVEITVLPGVLRLLSGKPQR